MDDKNAKALERVKEEIEKIDKKKNRVFFFVLDTKGNPSGSLCYIYNLALIAKDAGYDVTMLHQEEKDEEFVGVGDWLGEKYSSIPHANIAKDDVQVSPSDILFIPEIFSNVMNQSKSLPCKRIAILQNYDYILEQMPYAAQWGDFGIMEAVTNTDAVADKLHTIFPYVKTTTVNPYIDKMFGTSIEPKKMLVNIVAKNQADVVKIVKPFYWKYPAFKWVSFRDLRAVTKEVFAQSLREAAVTVWVDDDTSFGYTPLEAMRSGSIVIAKVPDEVPKWADEGEGKLTNSCVWFDSFHNVHRQIAAVVRSWITDTVPEEVVTLMKEKSTLYPYEETKKEFEAYLSSVIDNRKKEMEALINQFKTNEGNDKEKK